MPAVKNLAAAFLALAGMTGQLAAAPLCATERDMAAFRTAAVQQQLMVAGLTCNDMNAYNRFVISYRRELQDSDNDLKRFFIRQGSEAAYDTYKTKLANLSSLSDIANSAAYCDSAAASFNIALSEKPSLARFVEDQPLLIDLPHAPACPGQYSEADDARVRVARAHGAVDGVPAHALPAAPYGEADDRVSSYGR